ncbi:hypothetical protein HanOQP8_Chr02g0048671 [Helianthus annuus]|nr:hypothetical protein HanOQP8_Chr02g0048671 [Helianthus annuus]
MQDHRALCRVFLVDEYKSPSTHCIADIGVKISRKSDPNTVINLSSRRHENSSDIDCILCGDYIELNDLIDPGSCSSSSANSSCLTVTSDEYFDSVALLQELDKDILDQKFCVKYNLSTPAKSKEVVIRPVTSGNAFCSPSAKSIGKSGGLSYDSTWVWVWVWVWVWGE